MDLFQSSTYKDSNALWVGIAECYLPFLLYFQGTMSSTETLEESYRSEHAVRVLELLLLLTHWFPPGGDPLSAPPPPWKKFGSLETQWIVMAGWVLRAPSG